MKKLTFIFSMLTALIGLNANAAMYLVGNAPLGQGWDPSKGVEMTDNGDGTYTFVTEISGAVWFVFADGLDSSWDVFNGTHRFGPTGGSDQTIPVGEWVNTQKQGNGNGSYKFTGSGDSYTVTFDETNMRVKIEGYVEPVVFTSFTVAGNNTTILGTEWDVTNTDNDMTLDETDGLYKLVKNGVEIPAATNLEYKVAANYSWDNNWGQTPGGANMNYYFEEAGTYNLTFKFDLENEAVSLDVEKVEDGPVVDPVTGDFFILGQVNDNNWNPSTGIKMATVDEDVYTLTDAVFADSGDGYAYFSFTSKLGVDENDWSFAPYRRGAVEDGTLVGDSAVVLGDWGTNGAFKVLAGTYDVEVGLSSDYVKLTSKGVTPPEPQDDVYTVVGPEAIFGSNWNEADTTNDMTPGENGVYTWTKENVELAAGSFGFKVVGNHSWDNEWPMGYGNNWIKYVEEAGIYTIVITYEPEAEDSLKITCEITKTGSIEPVHYDGDVYIMGEVNDNGGWFTNVGVKMTRDEENNVYTATITTAGENIPEGEETGYSYFSFTKQLADSAADWDAIAPYRFGAVSDGDYWVTDEVLGTAIPLTNGGQSFRVPAGEWNLTLSVDNMTLVIEKVESNVIRGDVDKSGGVSIADVTTLIDMLLNGDNMIPEADCDLNGSMTIADVTTLIDYLLTGNWPAI